MATAQSIQTLLRFLSQDAKVPLAQAMGKLMKELQDANLITPSDIAKSNLEHLQAVFGDDKIARQVLNAAKRVTKKRALADSLPAPSPKKAKPSFGQPLSPAQLEESLALPGAELDEDKLRDAVVHTNRAPLFLAFTVVLLKYTMPEQPLSSRLSLAQAVVSSNAKAKAASLGLERGKAAEKEGWGEGQPIIKVMDRQLRVMKRWGYTWDSKDEEGLSQSTIDEQPNETEEPALWALDLEALRRSNIAQSPGLPGSRQTSTSQLPIYTPQSVRAYLLKSFNSPKTGTDKKRSNAAAIAEKEHNVGLVLGALDLLYQSWSSVLSKEDLDKRAWSWYTRVRPEVKAGAAGWGGKANVKLGDILDLRRPPDH